MKRQLLGWCIILSAIANVSSAGILLYVAQHTFDVRAIGSVNAYVQASERDPIPIKIIADRPIKVEVDGDVSIKEKPSWLR